MPSPSERPETRTRGLSGKGILLVLLATLFVGFCLFPFYIMLTTALKTSAEIAPWPPIFIFEPTFKNIQDGIFVSGGRSALFFVMNSIITTAVSTAAALIVGAMAAYGLAR